MEPQVMKVIFVGFAFVIMGCAIGYLKKDKYKYGLSCICMSFVLILADPASFEGFLKTGLVSTLKVFGGQISRIQNTLAVQQSSLESNRVQIASQQITLGSNNVEIAVLQSSFLNAQSNTLSRKRTLDLLQTKVTSQQTFLDSQQLALNSQQVALNKMQAALNSIKLDRAVTDRTVTGKQKAPAEKNVSKAVSKE